MEERGEEGGDDLNDQPDIYTAPCTHREADLERRRAERREEWMAATQAEWQTAN